MADRTYTIQVCPICRGTARQFARGRCVNECRGADVIPPMVDVEVVPLSTLEASEARVRELREALEAYATVCPCPGIVVEPGAVSGCALGGYDCPTCAALSSRGESG